MKIEIAESLALSYLKHVKKCVMYQTNWKPSDKWESFNDEEVEEVFDQINEHPSLGGIFKETSLKQHIRQAEVDALGMDQGDRVYAIDVAFHEAGLNYQGKEESATRVIKKLVRTYLLLLSYFPNKKYEIIFATPKVNHGHQGEILNAFEELKRLFKEKGDVEFKLMFNEEFNQEFLAQTILEAQSNADVSELFMRAYKLLQFYRPSEGSEENRTTQEAKAKRGTRKNRTLPELELEFNPTDPELFKRRLIESKRAKRTWFYDDGRCITDIWRASKLQESSNLSANIHSTLEARHRDESGLYKIRYEIID